MHAGREQKAYALYPGVFGPYGLFEQCDVRSPTPIEPKPTTGGIAQLFQQLGQVVCPNFADFDQRLYKRFLKIS